MYPFNGKADGRKNLNFDAVNAYSIVRGVLDMYEYMEKLDSRDANGI
jgi:hypothetical protein